MERGGEEWRIRSIENVKNVTLENLPLVFLTAHFCRIHLPADSTNTKTKPDSVGFLPVHGTTTENYSRLFLLHQNWR